MVAEAPTRSGVVATPEAVVVGVPEAEVAEGPRAAGGHSPDIVQADA
jgi:hypothetical protein